RLYVLLGISTASRAQLSPRQRGERSTPAVHGQGAATRKNPLPLPVATTNGLVASGTGIQGPMSWLAVCSTPPPSQESTRPLAVRPKPNRRLGCPPPPAPPPPPPPPSSHCAEV